MKKGQQLACILRELAENIAIIRDKGTDWSECMFDDIEEVCREFDKSDKFTTKENRVNQGL